DQRGRAGATKPGASTFGAIGGLTCYFMPELTRDALFEALRRRRHYGTTGTRLFLDLRATFEQPVTGFSEDPQLARAKEFAVREASMGDILRPGSVPMRLAVEVIGTAPIQRLDVLHGAKVVQTARPVPAADLGRRVRVTWQGAEYRGRGRETMWHGKLTLAGNRFVRFAPVNFLNPERKIEETSAGAALTWTSVTTGNLAGIDLWLDEARRGTLARRGAGRDAAARYHRRLRRGRSRDAGRRYGCLRRRRPRPADQRLSPARAGLEPAPFRRSRRDVPGRRRPSGLCARDAERRPSGLVEPDLSHRLTQVAWPAPCSYQLCTEVRVVRGPNRKHMLSSGLAHGRNATD